MKPEEEEPMEKIVAMPPNPYGDDGEPDPKPYDPYECDPFCGESIFIWGVITVGVAVTMAILASLVIALFQHIIHFHA